MKISYDREVDALYICFKETTVTTKHLEDGSLRWITMRQTASRASKFSTL